MDSNPPNTPAPAPGEARPGDIVAAILSSFDTNGVRCVYLRNYEEFPTSVGHDVDLLVESGCRRRALALLAVCAEANGWRILRVAEFGPLAVFIVDSTGRHCIHIDLFDRIEWHWIEFGDSDAIVARRKWNGLVHHPSPEDEVFLNICTRLIYQGVVRDKHKVQAAGLHEEGVLPNLVAVFESHIGSGTGTTLAAATVKGDWDEIAQCKTRLRLSALVHWGLLHPGRGIHGLLRYLRRSTQRILSPPGPFVVFTGADGVGKSTVIEQIVPMLEEITGLHNTLLFHWKPTTRSIRAPGDSIGNSQNPRALPARSHMVSLLFLGYHWLGFWYGWFRWVYPALVHSRPAVGDRYALDMYLDPRRFRLNVPGWLLKAAAFSVPRPHVVIGLTAGPEMIVRRKPELPVDEIQTLQTRLNHLAVAHPEIAIIDASNTVETVTMNVRKCIIEMLRES